MSFFLPVKKIGTIICMARKKPLSRRDNHALIAATCKVELRKGAFITPLRYIALATADTYSTLYFNLDFLMVIVITILYKSFLFFYIVFCFGLLRASLLQHIRENCQYSSLPNRWKTVNIVPVVSGFCWFAFEIVISGCIFYVATFYVHSIP